jgi:predicted permease
VIQIALSLVIVFAAGLLTRTLQKFATVDLGFQPDRVIALNVDPTANGHSNAEVSTILDELLNRARDLPGVKAASLSATTPYDSMSISMSMSIEVPGYAPKPVRGDLVVDFNFISSQYFKTLGQPLLRGRDFNGRDNEKSSAVAIVNEKFCRHYFGQHDPIGQKFRVDGEAVEIVGVVKDVRDQQIRTGPGETVYLPAKQGPRSKLTLLVRATNDPRHLVPSLLSIVRSIDRRMPVFSLRTLDINVDAGLSPERILAYLSALFAALTTLLAAIGLYGLLAYLVVRRTREIGIRYALGAQKGKILALFGRESAILVLLGLSIGGPLALLAANALRSLLFGVTASDPLTLCISIAMLALAALLATFIPLWRAIRVEPMTALRWE